MNWIDLWSVRPRRLAVALAVVASTTGFGCGHTLSFDQDRYAVRVAPVTSMAHKYEELPIDGLTWSVDKMVVPYESRGDWASTYGVWPDANGYANVMATVFGRVDGYGISATGGDANAVGLALADSLKPFGFRCGAPESDTAAGLPGVKVECEVRRRTTDVQKLRARELWSADGFILQVVTWTPGSKAAPDAEKFWASLRVAGAGKTASASGRSVAVAALPVDAVVSHAFGRGG